MRFQDDYVKRIVIVEDNKELREAYTLILGSLTDYAVTNAYNDCETCIKHLGKDCPHLIIMDLNLPGMNGIAGIVKIKKLEPRTNILVVTINDDSENVFDALCAGAIGYMTKDAIHDELIPAVERIFRGSAPMSAKIATMIVKSFHLNPKSPLTDRETAVLRKLAEGKTYDYIAQELHVTRDTVKTHIRHIYEKLQVDNKSEAVIKA
ncbi:MAG TPA: response regulator transcription factor, partial [Chryseosolibacter sp.]|nr:response regulator transcription factor [Chryseosolibacter sp.]